MNLTATTNCVTCGHSRDAHKDNVGMCRATVGYVVTDRMGSDHITTYDEETSCHCNLYQAPSIVAEETCKGCKFYKELPAEDVDGTRFTGRCRITAPGKREWCSTLIADDDWCGEWKPKETK